MLKNIISIKGDGLIIRFISFFWLIAKILIAGTWYSDREFPIISLTPYLQGENNLYYSNILSIFLLFLIIVNPRRLLVISLLCTELFIISCDYIFFQPWEWTYIVCFSIYTIYKNNSIKLRYTLHLFICSIYILSGIHKLNRDFLVDVWHRMILNDFLGLSTFTVLEYKLFFIGLSIPLLEIILGICLLFRTNKKKYLILIISLHIFILSFIGPFGLNYNQIVWPWNICMITILLLLYSNEIVTVKNISYLNIIFTLIPTILIICGSNSTITFNLYSGKNPQIYIFSSKPFPNQYPQNKDKCKWFVNVQLWSMHETNLPPNSDKWYIDALKKQLKTKFHDKEIKVIE